MEIQFSVTGPRRKALAQAVGRHIGAASKYLGAPTFAYMVGGYTIDRNGTLIGDTSQELLDALAAEGFEPLIAENAEHAPSANMRIIELPSEAFDDLAFANLERLVESKGALIKRSINADDLPIERGENTLSFLWLGDDASDDMVDACTHFITALCKMAKKLRRVTAKQKAVGNEKYAFRCFLLRLGFIGTEYKGIRKILLENLDGDAAFKQPPTSRGGTSRGCITIETIPPTIETIPPTIETAV